MKNVIQKLKNLPNFELIALISLSLFALVTAAWFPLLFSADAKNGDLTPGERSAIFSKYQNGEEKSYILTPVQPDTLLKRQISLCERKYKLLLSDFVPDALLKTGTDSGSFFKLTVESGDAIIVWHVQESWTQDWENRTGLYMDAETGDIYSFSYEGTCVANFEAYASDQTSRDVSYAASRLEKIIESPLQEGSGPIRTYGTGEHEIRYRIQTAYQESAHTLVNIEALPPAETEE